MSRTCRNCGAAVPAGTSFFCHRCGTQLPPELPVCRKCGKKQVDPESRFCDRCGVPLVLPTQPLPQAAPAMHKKACPQCGFENNGVALFFCKKCGAGLENTQLPGMVQEPKIQERPARIGTARQNGSPHILAARPRGEPVETPVPDRAPGSARKYRNIAIGVVVVILLIAAIAAAIIFMKPSGTPAAGSDNSTVSGLLGPLSKILPEKNATATGTAPKVTPKKGVAGNQGTAVFSDTPPA